MDLTAIPQTEQRLLWLHAARLWATEQPSFCGNSITWAHICTTIHNWWTTRNPAVARVNEPLALAQHGGDSARDLRQPMHTEPAPATPAAVQRSLPSMGILGRTISVTAILHHNKRREPRRVKICTPPPPRRRPTAPPPPARQIQAEQRSDAAHRRGTRGPAKAATHAAPAPAKRRRRPRNRKRRAPPLCAPAERRNGGINRRTAETNTAAGDQEATRGSSAPRERVTSRPPVFE